MREQTLAVQRMQDYIEQNKTIEITLSDLANFEYQYYITLVVTLWYIFTELGLIIENAGKLGAPISDWLAKGIAKLRDKTDGNIEKTVFKEKDE